MLYSQLEMLLPLLANIASDIQQPEIYGQSLRRLELHIQGLVQAAPRRSQPEFVVCLYGMPPNHVAQTYSLLGVRSNPNSVPPLHEGFWHMKDITGV